MITWFSEEIKQVVLHGVLMSGGNILSLYARPNNKTIYNNINMCRKYILTL